MIITDLCTLSIKDAKIESAIEITLNKDVIYKLYRIKEMQEYNDFFECEFYAEFVDKIKLLIASFIDNVDHEYRMLLDELLDKEYEFNNAVKIVLKKE